MLCICNRSLPLRNFTLFGEDIMRRPAYRKWFFMIITAVLALSGIRTGSAAACSVSPPADIPLSPARLQRILINPHHDVSTSEILGRKNAEALVASSIRNRTRANFRMDDTGILPEQANLSFSSLYTEAALRRWNRQPHVRSWIIRYIHDQDGEKDGAFSS